MRKRLLTLAVAVLAMLQTAWAYDFSATSPSGHTLYYEIISGTTNVGVVRPGPAYTDTYDNYVSGNVVIPDTVAYNGTTYNVTELRAVGVFGTFDGCDSIISVIIPNSVTIIGDWAFWNCHSLTSINIPNSVTTIGKSVFGNCISLTSITIPNSVTTIGASAFTGCTNLTSVTIPNSITTIEGCTFNACRSLTSITIPNSVTSIGESAFSNCSSLTSVTIGNSVTSIEDSAFIGCNNLYEVISLAILPPQLGEDIFPTTYMLKVPCGSANYYNSMASSWSQYFAEIEEMCNNITITVTSANESMGTVSGGGEYEVGTEITITATPNQGYRFVSWNDGNTDNPRTITVTEDATYIASFEESVGIESRDMLSELAFYPNPTSGILTFNRSDIIKVEVLDAMGRTVEVYENAYTIDISKLAKGYYAMRITTAEGVAVRKVIRN